MEDKISVERGGGGGGTHQLKFQHAVLLLCAHAMHDGGCFRVGLVRKGKGSHV
jgi:hypothetical protein